MKFPRDIATGGSGFLIAGISRLIRREYDRRVFRLGLTRARRMFPACLSRQPGLSVAPHLQGDADVHTVVCGGRGAAADYPSGLFAARQARLIDCLLHIKIDLQGVENVAARRIYEN